MNLESLGPTDRELIARWSYTIGVALKIATKDSLAAQFSMQFLNKYHGVNFKDGCQPWVELLIAKWRRKTPDVKQQAESIALAIFNQYMPRPAPSADH